MTGPKYLRRWAPHSLAAGLVGIALAWSGPAMAQYDDDYENGVQTPILKSYEDGGDGGRVGRFLTGVFEGDDEVSGVLSRLKGRFIQSSAVRDARAPEGLDPKQTGELLARREALGNDMVMVPLPKLREYAEEIARKLLGAAAIDWIDPKVIFVANGQIDARAFPEGTVSVTLGALRNIESEDEFAALLAHEFAHVILYHGDSAWFLQAQERGLAALELSLAVIQKIKEMSNRSGMSQWDQFKIRLIGEAVLFTSDVFIDSLYTRIQEDEADLLGTDILIRAGYNPDSMSLYLERLASQEKIALENDQKLQKQRSKEIEQRIEERGTSGFAASIGEVLGLAGKSVRDALRKDFGARHREAEARRETFAEYLDREYEDLEAGESNERDWQRMMTAPGMTAVMDGYKAVLDACSALYRQDYATAVERIREPLSTLPTSHALPRIVAAEISAAAGRWQEAIVFFRQSLAVEEPPLSAYTGLAEVQRRLGKPAESVSTLDRAKLDLKDPPQILPDRISVAAMVPKRRVGTTRALTPKREPASPTGALLARCKLEAMKHVFKLCAKAKQGKFQRIPPLPPQAVMAAGAPSLSSLLKLVRVTSDTLNARGGPNTGHSVVRVFKRGATLVVVDSLGKWYRIRDPAGRSVWVANWLTSPIRSEIRPRPATLIVTPPGVAPPTVAPPSVALPSPTQFDPAARLRRLQTLHDQGLITAEEYAAKRAEILSSL